MKTKILTLLAASLLAPTIAAAEGGLSGDAKLACEAIYACPAVRARANARRRLTAISRSAINI